MTSALFSQLSTQLKQHASLLQELLEPFSYLNCKNPTAYCEQIYNEVKVIKGIVKQAGSDSWSLELLRQENFLLQLMNEQHAGLLQQLPYYIKNLNEALAPLFTLKNIEELLAGDQSDEKIPLILPTVAALNVEKKIFHYVLVDDEPDFLEILEDHLKDHFSRDFEPVPHTFADPVLALETLKITDPSHIKIIFTDYKMPKMNGESFIQALRQIKGLERVPVIMITGMKPDLQSALRTFDEVYFLEKPFSEKRLAFYLGCCLKSSPRS